MIKTKLGILKQSEKALSKLMNANLDIKIAYTLGRIANKIGQELKTVEDLRVKLVEKYGDKDEKGQHVVPEDKKEEFWTEYSELLEAEVELDFNKITLEKLAKVNMTPAEMIYLDYLIEEVKDEVK